MIRVDYECETCGRSERSVLSPPPRLQPCPHCGRESRRVYSPVAVIGRRGDAAPPTTVRPSMTPACRANPMVPMVCHMSSTAGRAWAQLFRSGGSAEVAERLALAREREAAEDRPEGGPAVDSVHHHGHSHGHWVHDQSHHGEAHSSHDDSHDHRDADGHSLAHQADERASASQEDKRQ